MRRGGRPATNGRGSGPLLEPGEPAAFELLQAAAPRREVLVCDHASNRLPRRLGTLGVAAADREAHIAWDIGAAAVTQRLAARLGAAAVIGGYSRLVVDLNRAPHAATLIPRISGGVLIPGNLGLAPETRRERLRVFFEPYHAALEQCIRERTTPRLAPAVLAIHSFTPRLSGIERPWHVGILWDADPRLAVPLLATLRANRTIVVGDNEPYSGRHPADYTIDTHAEARGLAHASIEIRQDLIGDERGQERWASTLGDALELVLTAAGVYHGP